MGFISSIDSFVKLCAFWIGEESNPYYMIPDAGFEGRLMLKKAIENLCFGQH